MMELELQLGEREGEEPWKGDILRPRDIVPAETEAELNQRNRKLPSPSLKGWQILNNKEQ